MPEVEFELPMYVSEATRGRDFASDEFPWRLSLKLTSYGRSSPAAILRDYKTIICGEGGS